MFSKRMCFNTKSIGEAKDELFKIIKDTKETGEPTFVVENDKPEVVILSNEVYEKLVNDLNELEIIVFHSQLNERISKDPGKLIPADKVIKSDTKYNPFFALSDEKLFD